METKVIEFSYPYEAHFMVHGQQVLTTEARRVKTVEIPPTHYTYWPPGILDVWFRMAAEECYDEESDIFYAGYPAAWIIQVHGAPELVLPADDEKVEGYRLYQLVYTQFLPPTDVQLWDIIVEGGSITTIDQEILQHRRFVDRDQNDYFWCDNEMENFFLPQLFGEAPYEEVFEQLWE